MKLVKEKGTITSIPINEQLGRLGVTDFIRKGDLVQIIVGDRKVISFNIHKREFSQTMERFKESALNGTAGLARDIVHDMELVLVHPKNGYADYLQSNVNGTGTSPSGNETANITYATVYEDKTSLYEALIIEGIPVFAKTSI